MIVISQFCDVTNLWSSQNCDLTKLWFCEILWERSLTFVIGPISQNCERKHLTKRLECPFHLSNKAQDGMKKAIFADSYCPYPLGTICDSLRASNRTLGFLVSVVLPGEPTWLLYGTHILVSSHKIGKGAGIQQNKKWKHTNLIRT